MPKMPKKELISGLEGLLKSMSFDMKYKFLNFANEDDNKELQEVAKKCGIVLPAKDIAIFKGTFAFTDRRNLNGCVLPREEVEKSLPTLIGKAIDFDHFRKDVVGHWIKAELVEDEIVTYGIFFKGNFEDDFEMIQKLLENGNLGISFEAWGDRKFHEDGNSYDLYNIEWAGGALLIKTNPAFPGAGVDEIASKKILEYAKVMTVPKEFIHSSDKKKNVDVDETSRLHIWDFEMILRMLRETEFPGIKSEDIFDIDVLVINFEENTVTVNVLTLDKENEFQETKFIVILTPKAKILNQGRQIISVKKIKDNNKKIDNLSDLGEACIDKIVHDLICKAEEIDMKELLEKLQKAETIEEKVKIIEEIAKKNVALSKELEELKVSKEKDDNAKEDETAKMDVEVKAKEKIIVDLESELNDKKDELKAMKEGQEELINKAKEQAKQITERRAELTEEFAKDLSDEDILDDLKYENAKLKKENASLKDTSTTKTVIKPVDKDLAMGTVKKDRGSHIDELAAKVKKDAWKEKK